jgi:hypothetical protein
VRIAAHRTEAAPVNLLEVILAVCRRCGIQVRVMPPRSGPRRSCRRQSTPATVQGSMLGPPVFVVHLDGPWPAIGFTSLSAATVKSLAVNSCVPTSRAATGRRQARPAHALRLRLPPPMRHISPEPD